MTHFRYVPRAVLWRYPSGTAPRLPRWRSRRRADHDLDNEPRCSAGRSIADDALQGVAAPGCDAPAEEVFEAVPVHADAARKRVRRQLDRLIRTYNGSRTKPA